ncbi:MAG TPA: hypothetical protein VLV83_07150 [Acidobacteriota bacterium]|nr:hypothetical protein [Acidobacteriota bacterium]
MSSGRPKSAVELALEKLDAQDEFKVKKLTDEQREQIAQVRARFRSKIAETEIAFQGKLRQAVQSGKGDQVDELKQQLAHEKQRLNADMEAAVEKVRQEGE